MCSPALQLSVAKSRFAWIDGLKAFGIFLVVLGHLPVVGPVHGVIYEFHMPLFFMVSGFLVKPGGWEMTPGDFFKKRLLRFIGYYAVFGVLSGLFYCYLFRGERDMGEMLVGRAWSWIYGSASHNSPADLFPLVLWYFPALIVAFSLNYGCWRLRSPVVRFLVFVAIFVAGVSLHGEALPWEFESGMVASGFIALGYLGRIRAVDEAIVPRHLAVLLPAAVLGLGAVAMGFVQVLDVRDAGVPWEGSVSRYGVDVALAVLIAVAVVVSLAAIMKYASVPAWVEAVSMATIWIFPLHMLVFPYVDRVAGFLPGAEVWLGLQLYFWVKAFLVTAVITIGYLTFGLVVRWLRGCKTSVT